MKTENVLPEAVRTRLLGCLKVGLEESQRAEAPIPVETAEDGLVVMYHHPHPEHDEEIRYKVKLVPVLLPL